MTIQHKDIQDGDIHEPKGISTATTGSSYVSTGSGSGTWKLQDSTTLKGLAGDGGVAGKPVVSDGANGFALVNPKSYGTMAFTNNANVLGVTPTYAKLTGSPAPWAVGAISNMTFNTDQLTVVAGAYLAQFSVDASQTSGADLVVSYQLAVNGTLRGIPMQATIHSGDTVALGSSTTLALNIGDAVSLYVKSSVATNIDVKDATLSLVQIV